MEISHGWKIFALLIKAFLIYNFATYFDSKIDFLFFQWEKLPSFLKVIVGTFFHLIQMIIIVNFLKMFIDQLAQLE